MKRTRKLAPYSSQEEATTLLNEYSPNQRSQARKVHGVRIHTFGAGTKPFHLRVRVQITADVASKILFAQQGHYSILGDRARFAVVLRRFGVRFGQLLPDRVHFRFLDVVRPKANERRLFRRHRGMWKLRHARVMASPSFLR